MNASLSSCRKIGKYNQKIITIDTGVPNSSSNTVLNTLKSWHSEFTGLDPVDRNVGDIEYKGFNVTLSQYTGNIIMGAEGIVCVVSEDEDVPKTVTLKIVAVMQEGLISYINNEYYKLTGQHINTSNCYLTDVVLNLY